MSYLTPYYPHAIKAYLETRPALAELADTIAIYLLALAATGLLIFWSVKFYRPKPIRPKEPKHEESKFCGIFRSRVFKLKFSSDILLGSLFFGLVFLAAFGGLFYSLFTGQYEICKEIAFVYGLFIFSVFCLWLIGR